ncbi:MAG: helix-turn-helix domain-containing protein [Solirubrobacteraceae bacterium]
MSANAPIQEAELLDRAIAWLRQTLPDNWTVERSTAQYSMPGSAEPYRPDSMLEIQGPNGNVAFLVEAKNSFSPRDAERLLPGVAKPLRRMSNTPLLVVSNWLSARTRELLREQDVNYLDLTGNADIRTNFPAIFLSHSGASRNPAPAERERAGLRGAKAGRLIRTLLDVPAPYSVRELALLTGLTPGYVSRLLSALEYEALVDRSRTGGVTSVARAPLLRRWVETYDVLKSNEPTRLLAPHGPLGAFNEIGALHDNSWMVVTGSFAAVQAASVSAPELLMAYVRDPGPVSAELNLLPTREGANVVLLRPYDEVVWERTTESDGVRFAAFSQVAADLLTGPGRMPEEGAALVEWLEDGEGDRWSSGSRAAIEIGGGTTGNGFA